MISIKNLTKKYGKAVILENLSLEVKEGEFFTLLGPSGCGKTTTMRIVAGFLAANKGSIYLNNKNVTKIPAYKRDIGMVFQDYALFPHLSVFDNIAYGLKARKIPLDEIKKRVPEAVELVGLSGLEKRFPAKLSGGQQQRVALARALVIRPNVLLMDEPLSNLDAKLRLDMREKIKTIQNELGITTIFVTHDQQEAMSMSDRIAVMNKGKVEQCGPPREIYEKPSTLFVADFIGEANFLTGKVLKQSTEDEIDFGGITVKRKVDFRDGQKIKCCFRPESIHISANNDSNNMIEGKIINSLYTGSNVLYSVSLTTEIQIHVQETLDADKALWKQGDTVFIDLPHNFPVFKWEAGK